MSNSITSASAPRQPQELTPVALPRTHEAAPVKDAPKVRMPEAAEVKPDHKDLRRNLDEALQRMNEQMKQNGRNLNFSMDETMNRPVVTVKNTATGEVVRQIPTEVIVKVAHSIEDIKGVLHNKMA